MATRNTTSRVFLGILLASLILPFAVSAQPQPPVPRPLPHVEIIQPVHDQPIVLKHYKIKVDAENQVAQVVLELTFFNPNSVVMEETYIVPVPKGVVLSDLTLCSEGKCLEGKLLDANQARTQYEEIVRRTKDPALLEYVGDRAFQVRVFPIPPQGEQTVQIRFQEILERGGNLVQFLHRFTAQKPIEQLSAQIHVREDEPIANIYSPSHKVTVQKISDREMTVNFEATQVRQAQDLLLFYTVAEKELGIDLLPYRIATQDGYFILLLSPALVEQVQALPKDAVFIFDISGSMAGEKIDQAKQSLKHAIGRLGPDDRFNVLVFSDTVREFKPQLTKLSEVDRGELERFINELEAAGGTDINDALLRGLDFFGKDDRLKTVVFLTDGLPSNGEQEPAKIVQNVTEKNKALGARLFVFGVGYDVNTHLLDELSSTAGGFSTYVEPGQSIEREISQFYDKVGAPLLTDLKIDFGTLSSSLYDLYPTQLPDLFKGSQIQIVGRYSKAGQGKAVLTGKRGSQEVRYEIEMSLPEANATYSFLPKFWASRKIGHLLDQIRLKGENKELVQSVKTLAEKFGIVTPYTSYFAAPADAMGNITITGGPPPVAPNAMSRSFMAAPSGQSGVQYSQQLGAMKEGYNDTNGLNLTAVYDPEIGETFHFESEVWKPANYTNQSTIKVKFNSDAYFWLVQNSNLKGALKLGERVIVPVKDKYIEVAAADAKEGLTQTRELTQTLQNAGIDLASSTSQGGQPQTNTQPNNGASGSTDAKTTEPKTQTSQNDQTSLLIALGAVVVLAGASLAIWLMRR